MPVYGPFPGDIFKLRLANMRSHKPANLSRSGVKQFLLLLFGAGGRAFGSGPFWFGAIDG